MVKVIGVRFRNAGKIYYFDPLDLDIEVGQNVIVETARGIEYGHVLIAPREVDDSKVIQPLKAVIRLATPEDDEIERKNKEKEKDAFKICLEKIAKHKLQMKLIDAEYTFDNNKVLFYFTADGRIDFRELVKDLASVFKTRIELRRMPMTMRCAGNLGWMKVMRLYTLQSVQRCQQPIIRPCLRRRKPGMFIRWIQEPFQPVSVCLYWKPVICGNRGCQRRKLRQKCVRTQINARPVSLWMS